MEKTKIAFIGVGAISGIYLENITNTFKELEIIGVCDLIKERAKSAKEKYNIKKIYEDMHETFSDKDVDIVLNLTRPYEHYEVTKAALLAGKHVYSEKPLGASLKEGLELVKIAEDNNLYLGGAPDTFLGAGIQTCRKLIDDGFIGDIVGAAAFMICRGHETWHPDPDFYYKHGGGPMMDMGPYYLSALVNLVGGVKEVTGVTKKSFDTRLITSSPHYGDIINVDVPTYVDGILTFDNGAQGTIFTTFDVHYENQARFEIYGTKGTLFVPDPNTFTGPIKIFRPEHGETTEFPSLFDYKENSRGIGLAEMATAIKSGRRARTDYKLTLHVLEIMETIEQSSKEKRTLKLLTKYEKNYPMNNFPFHGIIE